MFCFDLSTHDEVLDDPLPMSHRAPGEEYDVLFVGIGAEAGHSNDDA